MLYGLNYRDECRDAFIQLKILTLPCVFILETLLFIKNNEQLYKAHKDIHTHHTRYKDNLIPCFCRLKKSQKRPESLGLNLFNKLTRNLKDLPLKNFKEKVKELLVRNAFFGVEEYLNHNISD